MYKFIHSVFSYNVSLKANYTEPVAQTKTDGMELGPETNWLKIKFLIHKFIVVTYISRVLIIWNICWHTQ